MTKLTERIEIVRLTDDDDAIFSDVVNYKTVKK